MLYVLPVLYQKAGDFSIPGGYPSSMQSHQASIPALYSWVIPVTNPIPQDLAFSMVWMESSNRATSAEVPENPGIYRAGFANTSCLVKTPEETLMISGSSKNLSRPHAFKQAQMTSRFPDDSTPHRIPFSLAYTSKPRSQGYGCTAAGSSDSRIAKYSAITLCESIAMP